MPLMAVDGDQVRSAFQSRLVRLPDDEPRQWEADWWAKAGLEPAGLARQFWLQTHPFHVSADDSEKPGPKDESTPISGRYREPRPTKRTQLPGNPA
jgi:hypothetical protein